jgi:hypothetical protein
MKKSTILFIIATLVSIAGVYFVIKEKMNPEPEELIIEEDEEPEPEPPRRGRKPKSEPEPETEAKIINIADNGSKENEE